MAMLGHHTAANHLDDQTRIAYLCIALRLCFNGLFYRNSAAKQEPKPARFEVVCGQNEMPLERPFERVIRTDSKICLNSIFLS